MAANVPIASIQILSKILMTSDISIIETNLLTPEYFVGYENEINFILNHVDKYDNVPDKATFLSNFPDFEVVDVTESDKYLVSTIREEYLFYKTVPVIQNAANLLKTDSNAAVEYVRSEVRNLEPEYDIEGVDIISQSMERFEQYQERKENQDNWFFESGFKELDDITHGIQRGEELLVLVARTNQGKSWILEKMCAHVWQTGFNVGYMSPEMSATSIGFRFDTLTSKFSNKGLMWGKSNISDNEYNDYIDELKTKDNKFIVSTPADFGRSVTVTKLRNWVKKYKLDMIAIDGITYLTDERFRRGDNKTTTLTNISEDLMSLSVEMKIPILVVVQANRSGAISNDDEDGTPELESIRDSDGIAHNASKVISIRQKKNGVLEIGVKKQRFGRVGDKLNYMWDIDTGEFTWIPSSDDISRGNVERTVKDTKKKYSNDKADVF